MIIGNKSRTALKIKSKEYLHDNILEQYDFLKDLEIFHIVHY